MGNWLTREQAKELLAVPDRSTLKGKRDYMIIALLVGCALRRQELATLNIEDIQLREGRWVIIDLRGKGGRIRTVAVPIWVKQGINAWMTAAKIEDGRLLRPVSKSGKILRAELGDWAIWSVVEQSEANWHRALRRTRSAPHLRQTLQEEWWRSGADKILARALVDTEHGALPGIGAGDRNRGERQFGIMKGRRGAGKLVRTACYRIQMCRKIMSE
jgi:integrase